MRLYLLALNPTDSVTEGFLPAAGRLGLDVTVLTEPGYERAHQEAYEGFAGTTPRPRISACEVRDFREVVGWITRHTPPGTPFGVFSNSDHLQTQTALAAAYFGLPGKDWKAALRAKNKAEMRRHLAGHRSADVVDTDLGPANPDPADSDPGHPDPGPIVWAAEIPAGQDPLEFAQAHDVPYPCVVKPREGVASEDVVLAGDAAELRKRAAEIQASRPGQALVVEEFLRGDLHTLETLGDADGTLHVLGGFRTELSPPPYFVEERMTFEPAAAGRADARQVLGQLAALGVGFGACHTEFVVGDDGRARVVEVNYRAVGDQCDLMLAELLGIPLFEHILRTHLGEPLPAELGARTDGRARQECPRADRAGTLTSAPEAAELTVDGVRLTYRPLRSTGERHELYHTNRDYLGIVRAIGTDQAAVDRVVTGFLAERHWEITP